MVGEVLAGLNFSLATFDAYLTRRRMNDYGVDIELNTPLRELSRTLGPELGCLILVILPAAIWSGAALLFHLTWVLGLLVGMRLKMFHTQLLSILVEKRLKAWKAKIDKASGGASDTSPDVDSDESPSPPPDTSSKEDNE